MGNTVGYAAGTSNVNGAQINSGATALFQAQANDLVLYTVQLSPATAVITTPPGAPWTLLGDWIGPGGPDALDSTSQHIYVYYATGAQNSTPVIAHDATTITQGWSVYSAQGGTWDLQAVRTNFPTVGTSWPATNADGSLSVEPGDMILLIIGSGSDSGIATSPLVTMAGVTVKTSSSMHGQRNTPNTNGNDHTMMHSHNQITAGTVTAVPQLGTSWTANAFGLMVAVRIRNTGSVQTKAIVKSHTQTPYTSTGTAMPAVLLPAYGPGDRLIQLHLVRPATAVIPAGSGAWTKIAEITNTGGAEAAGTGTSKLAVFEANPTSYTDVTQLNGSMSGLSCYHSIVLALSKPIEAASWATTVVKTATDDDVTTTAISLAFGDQAVTAISDLLIVDSGHPGAVVSSVPLALAGGGAGLTVDAARDFYNSTTSGNDAAQFFTAFYPNAVGTITGITLTGTATAAASSNATGVLLLFGLPGYTPTPPSDNGKVKVYTGAAFAAAIPKVWNGSAWVPAKAKVWDGSQWVTTNA